MSKLTRLLSRSRFIKSCTAAILGVSIIASSTPAAFALDAGDKTEVEKIVREYLLANPEMLIEMQQALEEKQTAEASIRIKQTLTESGDSIFNDPFDPAFGNSNGDVTVVEFFDYNCGFCRRGLADMEYIIANDKNVKFVLKEYPIFGPNSAAVHTVALAFNNVAPEKYYDYHVAMMRLDGQIDQDRALELAANTGIDMDALNKEMQAQTIPQSFNRTNDLANALGITGTPSYVIGDEVVVGALGKDVLIEKIENYRKCGSTSC